MAPLASTILSVDLSKNWTNSSVVLQTTTKPSGVPLLSYGNLWYDQSKDLLYTGFTGRVSSFGNAPSPYSLSLWSFKPDGTGSGTWNEEINPGDDAWGSLTRPYRGSQAFGGDSAFVLGGTENSQTDRDTENLDTDVPLTGLVQFNMTTKKFTNSTAKGFSSNQTIEMGQMHYVPSFGPNGLFMLMGGDDPLGPSDKNNFGMDNIWVYEPVQNKWFNQTATGNIPEPRREFCLAGVNSTNGTYEMYASLQNCLRLLKCSKRLTNPMQLHVWRLQRPSWLLRRPLR